MKQITLREQLKRGGWCENKTKIKHEELGNKLSMQSNWVTIDRSRCRKDTGALSSLLELTGYNKQS